MQWVTVESELKQIRNAVVLDIEKRRGRRSAKGGILIRPHRSVRRVVVNGDRALIGRSDKVAGAGLNREHRRFIKLDRVVVG